MRVPLVLIVLVFPVAEIWLTAELARAFGLWFLLYLVLAAALGVYLIRGERLRMGARLQSALAGGASALPALLFTFRRLAAGILLLLPGVLSDVAAVILLLLPARAAPAESAMRGNANAARGPQVIEGEFREVESANDASGGELPHP